MYQMNAFIKLAKCTDMYSTFSDAEFIPFLNLSNKSYQEIFLKTINSTYLQCSNEQFHAAFPPAY